VTRDRAGLPPSLEQSFAACLDRLVPEGSLGLAVSGGPDSLALLLLAAAVRPGTIRAATVDHQLRAESAAEAARVAEHCAAIDVPHDILKVEVGTGASLQAQARCARYAALAEWAKANALSAVATAHHADDQAETLLMRLARGSGVGGLAGIRERRRLRGTLDLVRPLLTWRKADLAAIVVEAGWTAIDDPANRDERHDRTRVRALLAANSWLDASRLARSAGTLAEAEEALCFAVERMATERVVTNGASVSLDAGDLPSALQRRLLVIALEHFGRESPNGPDLDRALATLRAGETCTLAGTKLAGGQRWRLTPTPPRRT